MKRAARGDDPDGSKLELIPMPILAPKPDRVNLRPKSESPFAMVPLEIAADRDLSPGAKLLFGVILSLTKGPWGKCFARNETLAEMTGLCVKQVLRLLRDLEKRG